MFSKLIPIKTINENLVGGGKGKIKVDNLYNILSNYIFGNFQNPQFYSDEICIQNAAMYRFIAGKLALELITQGDNDRAIFVLDKISKEIPINMHFLDLSLVNIIKAYVIIR